jgi:uncharacterized protein (TIGR00730 family)
VKIGITLTSSLSVGQEYIDLTEAVAKALATQGHGIVYGGTDYGMMSTLASSYKAAGGSDLTGIMAKDLMTVTKGYVAYSSLDTSFLEETMEDRKRRIVEQSDAFIILPGGYGTFEEIGSIIGGKVNKLYDKPIALYNFNGFYSTLIAFLDEMQQKDFSKIPITEFVFVSDNLDEILTHFATYQTKELEDKFV